MLAALTGALVSTALCVLIHYEVLRWVWRWTPQLPLRPRKRMLVVILGAYCGHVVEVVVFAFGFAVLVNVCGLESSDAAGGLTFERALYYSLESYTSLGSSSTYPQGPLRLFAGAEGIIGLLLIGWSTSFTYLAMREFWSHH